MNASPLHERLAAVVGQRSSRSIGDLTGTNHETVRRYLSGNAPSVEFLQALCRAFGVSADWLLTGKGPMRTSDVRHHALREADPGELLTALASSVETVLSRVERLEQFVQVIDVRLRGLSQEPPDGHALAPSPDQPQPHTQANPQPRLPGPQGARSRATPLGPAGPAGPAPAGPQDAPVEPRVLRLRDALAQRPRDDGR